MAKITPTSLVSAISGRDCSHDSTYFATNKRTGQVYAVRLCNPYQGELSTKQKANLTAFATKATLASQWWKENKPSTTTPDGTAAYQALLASYKGQNKCGNIFAYMRSKMNDEGTVTIGSSTYPLSGSSSSSSSDTPSGGDTTPSGTKDLETD